MGTAGRTAPEIPGRQRTATLKPHERNGSLPHAGHENTKDIHTRPSLQNDSAFPTTRERPPEGLRKPFPGPHSISATIPPRFSHNPGKTVSQTPRAPDTPSPFRPQGRQPDFRPPDPTGATPPHPDTPHGTTARKAASDKHTKQKEHTKCSQNLAFRGKIVTFVRLNRTARYADRATLQTDYGKR